MVYKWKHYNYPVSAQEAGEFLKMVEGEVGCLTPAVVLERSRDINAVLHPCFEWQDEVAAEQYRKVQSREILRNLVVVRADDDEDKTPIRAFLHVETEHKEEGKESFYLSAETALSNTAHKDYILKKALSELISFKVKYAKLKELARELSGVFDAIDEVTKQLEATT